MDPALVELYEEGSADDIVSVILRLAPGAPLVGVRVVSRFGPIATCRLRRGDIPRVRAEAQVLSMKAARFYGPTLEGLDAEPVEEDDDLEPKATDRRRPTGHLPTGAGVVVAHIDWGLDIACRALRKADGSTRILALWDQAANYDTAHPNAFGYGRIYSRAEIDAALRSSDPYRTLGYAPWTAAPNGGSHGTHTTSISCGNGRDGGPEGIAPEADIVFVDLSTRTADGPTPLGDSVAFLEGMDFVARCAGPRPFAINASLGRQAGQKDGLTLTEQGIDAFLLAAPGRAVVQSAGNYFEKEAHATRQLAPGGAATIHFELPTGRGEAELDLWYRGADRLGIELRGPPGVPNTPVPLGGRATVMHQGHEVGRIYHRLDDPNNHDNQVFLTLKADAPAGDWALRVTGDHVADGRVHAWIERVAPGAQRRMRFVADEVRRELTLGTIATSLWSIAVGAYDSHATDRTPGRFSSSGPTRDHRRLKPFVAAPGVKVLASRSPPRNGSAPPLIRMNGTSMAAPHVTGAAALMFAAAPRPLSIHETRALISTTADPVAEDATPTERLRLGAGYLDIATCVAAAAAVSRTPVPDGEQVAETQALEAAPEGEALEAVPAEAAMAQTSDVAEMAEMTEMTETDADDEGFTFPPVEELSDAEMEALGELAEARFDRGDRGDRGWRGPAALPFQFQIPLGGGPAGIAVPVGGPFALTVPLGGSPPAPAPAAAAQPAPAPPVAAPAKAEEPLAVAAPDPALLMGTPDTAGELAEAYAASGARNGGFAHSAAAFAGLAAELDDGGGPSPRLSATRLFGWLNAGGEDGLVRRVEQLMPGWRLEIVARPNTPSAGLALRSGDLLLRTARGQGFGAVAVVAAPDLVTVDQLAPLGWRGEGDPEPPPGRYVQVVDFGPWTRGDVRPLARRVATGAGLSPPDTLLLRLERAEGLPDAFPGEGETRPTLRRGSRGEAVREAQTKLNLIHAHDQQQGGTGLADCPLAVDGAFGQHTHHATVAFQRVAFPDQPKEWDGVIGPRTWAKLDAFARSEAPPRPGPPIVPVVVSPLNPPRWRAILGGLPNAPLTTQNAVRALIDGPTTYETMTRDIRAANGERSFIYLLGWDCFDNFPLSPGEPDKCSTTLNRLITDAVGRGVQVRAMIWQNLFKPLTIREVAQRINAITGASGNAACIVDGRAGGAVQTIDQTIVSAMRAAGQAALAPITLLLSASADGRRLLAEIDADIAQLPFSAIAAHHQKVMVIFDGERLVAYCGGLDLNPNRARDTTNCLPGSRAESIKPADPQHDTHCRIVGPAAAQLLKTFVDRWQDHPEHAAIDAAKSPLRGAPVASVPSPAVPNPSAQDAPFGGSASVIIARTYNPPLGGTVPKQRDVRTLLQRAVANAQRFIYFEDQYLWDFDTPSGGPVSMATALNQALPRVRHITVLVPANKISDFSWAQRAWRSRFIAEVRRGHAPEIANRFRVFQRNVPPCTPDGCLGAHTYVHSKCWVFDDELAVIGSANCNRRGYQHDSELDAFIFDDSAPGGAGPPILTAALGPSQDAGEISASGQTFAQQFRQALWQEHLGVLVPDGADNSAWPTGPAAVGSVVPLLVNRPEFVGPRVDPLAAPIIDLLAEKARRFADPVSPP
jgi:phosphatidylserine/phosphatidylglycerophosphate/cardiolipin synthase-like enzyme/subtilisin family serine protease